MAVKIVPTKLNVKLEEGTKPKNLPKVVLLVQFASQPRAQNLLFSLQTQRNRVTM